MSIEMVIICNHCVPIAQWLERRSSNPDVQGSSLGRTTSFFSPLLHRIQRKTDQCSPVLSRDGGESGVGGYVCRDELGGGSRDPTEGGVDTERE